MRKYVPSYFLSIDVIGSTPIPTNSLIETSRYEKSKSRKVENLEWVFISVCIIYPGRRTSPEPWRQCTTQAGRRDTTILVPKVVTVHGRVVGAEESFHTAITATRHASSSLINAPPTWSRPPLGISCKVAPVHLRVLQSYNNSRQADRFLLEMFRLFQNRMVEQTNKYLG